MHSPSPTLAATLQALRGEADVHVIVPALSDWSFARVLALAPGIDSVVGPPGAVASVLPNLLAPAEARLAHPLRRYRVADRNVCERPPLRTLAACVLPLPR
jgi:hypothetical protein